MLMDSGNSSSMQSNSSGGGDHDHDHDQEYNSRSFLPAAPQPLFSPQDPDFLHPFSDFRDPVFINWPNPGSDPNTSSFPVTGAGSTSSGALPPPPAPPKNPKKRTRASRRAPTTVLTTDTSNFRAMVQEFTGIPAPPFSATAYSRLVGGPYRQSNNVFSSSSLLNMGGQSQLLGSGQQMGLSGQPDPILQSLVQQQQQLVGYQPQQSPPRTIARLNAAFEGVGDGGNNNNMLFRNSNNED